MRSGIAKLNRTRPDLVVIGRDAVEASVDDRLDARKLLQELFAAINRLLALHGISRN